MRGKLSILFLSLFFTSNVFAFTLISSPPTKFPSPTITVNVAGNSCDAGGFSNQELLEWTGEAIDDFWNGVSTSAIELKLGKVNSEDKSSVTDDNVGSIYNDLTAGTILIACNDLTNNFDGSTSSNINYTNSTLAIGSINLNASSEIVGIVLINTSASYGTDHTQDVATIAHEIGHALGIGHSSNPAALMYYNAGAAINNRLNEDDKDAITYLYPLDEDIASCGSVAILGKDDDDFSGPFNFLVGFCLVIIVSSLLMRRPRSLRRTIAL